MLTVGSDAHTACGHPFACLLRLEQPRVLGGYDGLVGEGLEERKLLSCERAKLGTSDGNYPDHPAISEHWYA